MPITNKQYKCTQCGNEVSQATNHYGPTWSYDRFNTCTKCPPYKKYQEFGGQTVWECMETESEKTKE